MLRNNVCLLPGTATFQFHSSVQETSPTTFRRKKKCIRYSEGDDDENAPKEPLPEGDDDVIVSKTDSTCKDDVKTEATNSETVAAAGEVTASEPGSSSRGNTPPGSCDPALSTPVTVQTIPT